MRHLLMIFLFCCYFGIYQINAQDTHTQLNNHTTGYIDSSSTADPLTESMTNWGYTGNVGFPWSYRCIGIQRSGTDASKEVNRLVIHLEKLIAWSTETGEEIPSNMEIYTSNDNTNYTIIDSNSYLTSLETLPSGNLEIVFDGLSITQSYIKLRCPRTDNNYTFGSTNFQQIISLYTMNEAMFGDNQIFLGAQTGYNDSSSTANPLTESMTNWGYTGNVGFPWSYRCIGLKKDNSIANQEVSRILIDFEKLITWSTETGEEIINDLELYVSEDNLNYRLISSDYAKYIGRYGNGIKILFAGLSIKEQYIKLRCPRTAASYVYGSTGFQDMVKLIPATERKQIFALVGFEDSYPHTSVTTETLSKFGYISSVAFPWSYRTIGLKKDDSEDGLNVNRLVINLKKLNIGSSETGVEIANDLDLYVSNDNLSYSLVPKTYSIYTDILNDGLTIVIEGLDITHKYIKLRCPRTSSGYVFGQTNLQSALSAFRSTPDFITAIELPRFTYGTTAFKVSATGHENGTIKVSYVGTDGLVQNLWNLSLSSDGAAVHSGTLNFQSLPAGKLKLRFEIFDTNNKLTDRKDSYVFNTTGLVTNSLQADNVSLIVPGSGDFTGTWESLSKTTGISENLNYYSAQSSDAACSVTLPDAGWCAVYIGLIGGDSSALVNGLEANPFSVQLEYWRSDIPPSVNTAGDAFVGCYDLSGGKTITISRATGTTPLRISHIAVHKLSQSKTAIVTQASSLAPRIIVHNDGYSHFFDGSLDSESSLQATVGAYNNYPIYSYDWCLGSTTVFNINTHSGISFGTNDPTLYYRDGDRLAGTLVQSLLANNINPLSVVCDKGDQQGTPVNVVLRMGAFYSPPYSYSHNGPILNGSNTYRQKNLDGSFEWKLSYAFPEVRSFILEVLRDSLNSNVDGVHLQFLRHPPFFGYDQPIIDEYVNRHGSFNSTCYMNSNWQQIQRDMMTDLVGDIYQMIQSEAPAGKTIKLKVSFDQQNYYRQGLDIAAWISNGWVDVISPGCYGVSAQLFDLSPFVTMVNGTNCKIFVHAESTIMGQDPSPEEENGEIEVVRVNMSLNQFRKYFMDMHVQGADGLYPFNYNGAHLADAVEDMKNNEIWQNFKEPFIDWFY